jgi:hypothetical protein
VTYNNNVLGAWPAGGRRSIRRRPPPWKESGPGCGVDGADDDGNIAEIDKTTVDDFCRAERWKYSRRIVDPKVFDQVKMGDRVDITWSTDLTVDVQ